MKKRIALVGNSSLTMYNFRADLIKELIQKGYDVTVIAPMDSDVKVYHQMGSRFLPIPIDCKGTNPLKDIALEGNLTKIYKREKFDFIFHYTIKPVIYGSFAANKANTPQISVITGLGYTFGRQGLLHFIAKTLYQHALKTANGVWFLNQDDRELFNDLRIVSYDKSRVINGEGINVNAFQSNSTQPTSFQFLFIGRMLWDKGVGEYIEAARVIKREHPEIQFTLLGPTNSSNPMAIESSQIRAWEDENIVSYLGITDDIRPYLEQASCLVLPSYREGISRVLLEACAMKRPIITTNTTGCRDIVEDQRNGLLCEVKSPESLIAAMQQMYSLSNEEREHMGEEGRKIALEKFDQRIINNIYLNTIQTAIG